MLASTLQDRRSYCWCCLLSGHSVQRISNRCGTSYTQSDGVATYKVRRCPLNSYAPQFDYTRDCIAGRGTADFIARCTSTNRDTALQVRRRYIAESIQANGIKNSLLEFVPAPRSSHRSCVAEDKVTVRGGTATDCVVGGASVDQYTIFAVTQFQYPHIVSTDNVSQQLDCCSYQDRAVEHRHQRCPRSSSLQRDCCADRVEFGTTLNSQLQLRCTLVRRPSRYQ